MTNREYYDLIMRSSDGIATMRVFRKNGEKQIFRCTNAEENLPETSEIAMKLLEGYPLPTLAVSSGYGLYPMWFFSEPIRIGDGQQRERIKAALTGFGNSIMQTFADAGYKLDNVFGISHLDKVFLVDGYNYLCENDKSA